MFLFFFNFSRYKYHGELISSTYTYIADVVVKINVIIIIMYFFSCLTVHFNPTDNNYYNYHIARTKTFQLLFQIFDIHTNIVV